MAKQTTSTPKPTPKTTSTPKPGGNGGDKGQSNGNPVRGGDRPTKR